MKHNAPHLVYRRLAALLCLFALLLPAPARAGETEAGLRLSEVMAYNNLLPLEGRLSDWVEIHNSGTAPVSLEGWGISDREAVPYKARLSGVLAPGAYLALPCDGEGLGFSLSREGERLFLTSPGGRLADSLSYENLPADASLIRTPQDDWQISWSPTPGLKNTRAGRDEADEQRYLAASAEGLYISEVLASNDAYLPGEANAGWAELYNASPAPIKLKGLYLSKDALNLKQYAFPDATLKAGAYALVYCSPDGDAKKGGGIFLNQAFEIKRNSGALVLSDGERVIDAVSLGGQFGGVSYGRPEGQGAFRYFNLASPQNRNPGEGYLERLEAARFSRQGGFIKEPFLLELSAGEGAAIHFTLDGREPDKASPRYENPIEISKNAVVRAAVFADGKVDAPLSAQTYLFDTPQEAVTVCISGDPATFFGGMGIFEPGNHKLLSQKRINVEMYGDGGSQEINQMAVIRLTGGTSAVYVPRTFTLYARGRLGADSFAYNPFADRHYPTYSALTLRHGGTDTKRTKIRDAFLSGLARGYGVMYLSSAPAMVYLNGQFWGAFNLRERANQASIAQWEGITDEEIIQNIDIVKNRGVVVKGSKADLDALAAFCRTKDLSLQENLDYVLARLDLDSLLAHTAMQMFSGNSDLTNVRYYRLPGGKWKLLLYDLDLSMLNGNPTPVPFYAGSVGAAAKHHYGEFFPALMKAPAVRDRFFTLAGRMLAERFTPAYLENLFGQWEEAYNPLMAKHFGKWKDMNLNGWKGQMDRFEEMLLKRPALVMKYLIRDFKLTEEEAARYFGAFQEALAASPWRD